MGGKDLTKIEVIEEPIEKDFKSEGSFSYIELL
jgi:hypothetical protein